MTPAKKASPSPGANPVVDPEASRSDTDPVTERNSPQNAPERPESDLEGPEAAEAGSNPGPAVIDGPFGTTVDSTDESLGKLRVEVNSNLSLDNKVVTPGQKIEVTDTAEARGALAVGHLRLLEDDEQLDDE